MAHHRQAEGATKGAVHVNKSRPIHLKHPGDPTHPENSAWHSMAITRTACWRDNHRLRVTSDPSIVTCLNCLELKAVHNAIKELPVGSKARKDLRHVERGARIRTAATRTVGRSFSILMRRTANAAEINRLVEAASLVPGRPGQLDVRGSD